MYQALELWRNCIFQPPYRGSDNSDLKVQCLLSKMHHIVWAWPGPNTCMGNPPNWDSPVSSLCWCHPIDATRYGEPVFPWCRVSTGWVGMKTQLCCYSSLFSHCHHTSIQPYSQAQSSKVTTFPATAGFRTNLWLHFHCFTIIMSSGKIKGAMQYTQS